MIVFVVGLRSHPKDGLDLKELQLLAGAPRRVGPARLDDLAGRLTEIAEQVRAYGASALRGDTETFDEGRELRRRQTQGPWVGPAS